VWTIVNPRKPVHEPDANLAVLASRYWWTCCMTTEPSPTADATRLTDCARVAHREDPGTLVSKTSGGRSSRHPAAAVVATSVPVTT
jgi:hypothetical protein